MPTASSQSYDDVTIGSERGFGIVFAALFLLIGLWPLTGSNDPRIWSLAVAGGFLLCSYVFPRVLSPLNKIWFQFGMLLFKVVSPLTMGLLFILTFVPTGLIMRALGKDLLRLRRDPEAETYWVPRDPDQPSSMSNQF